MQVRADPKKMIFDLEGALARALEGDRTLWLMNVQHGAVIGNADRIYLWSSGLLAKDGKRGQLTAISTVRDPSQPHAQNEWQADFWKTGDYNATDPRVQLFVDALISPPVLRTEVLAAYPDANTQTAFFRNGHIQTTAPVEPKLDEVLMGIIQDRLNRLYIAESVGEGLSAEDLRRWATREIAVRDGQALFRKSILLTREGRCAVTGTTVEACLQAAHIRPYLGPHTNKASNGILLRADVHALFDRGLIRIDPKACRISVHESLKATEYGRFDGSTIHDAVRLDRECLAWRWDNGAAVLNC